MADWGGNRRNAGRPLKFKTDMERLRCFELVEKLRADLNAMRPEERRQLDLQKDPFAAEHVREVVRLRAELQSMSATKRKRIHKALERGEPTEKIPNGKDLHDIRQELGACRISGQRRLYRARRVLFELAAEGLRQELERPQITWRSVKEAYQRIKRELRSGKP
jgi:hypothetical protein